MKLRVATVAWKLRHVRSDGEFLAHFHDLVSAAYDEGANLVVFPELILLELLSLAPDLEEKDVPKFLIQFAEETEKWIQRISSSSEMTIVGGSHFKQTEAGIFSVCATAVPGRDVTLTPKIKLARYERECWGLIGGDGLGKLPSDFLGVTIGSDCEFPESGRALAEAGVLVQCVPAFTETRRGFQRIRWACQARAMENQNFLVHSSLVGALGYEPVPVTYGSSAVIAPSVEPFPEGAILAETAPNEEGIAVADLDLERLAEVRTEGGVHNWEDRDGSYWRVG